METEMVLFGELLYTYLLTRVGISILAAGLFLILIFVLLRPKLIISDDIARASYSGKKTNYVKIVNKTRFPIINVALSAEIHTEYYENGETIKKADPIKFNYPDVFMISRNKFWGDNVRDNAIRFSFKDDLDEAWNNRTRTYLVVHVIARHSLSNLSRVFTQTYKSDAKIKNGTFEFGNSVKIIELETIPIIEIN